MNDTESTPAADLPSFLKKHVRPYDPATDDYERQPFAADIKEGKTDPIYNAHSYHTKVPPRSIIPYILHYTQPGDLVIDPFCGSGMTGVAAQMCALPPLDLLEQFPELKESVGPRGCILNDLSPAACHIAYNYNTPVDVVALKREFERIKTAVTNEFDWLYGTEHYEPAVGVHDSSNPEVASRLKNPPEGKSKHNLLEEEERIWELLTKADVETRLGYPVTELAREKRWGDLDVAKVEHWVCIPGTIQYTIWSDVYRCEGFVTIEEPTGKVSSRGKNAGKPMVKRKRVERGCGKDIILWDVAVDVAAASVASEFACPHCAAKWTKTDIPRSAVVPVFTSYDAMEFKSSKAGSPRLAIGRFSRRITALELTRVQQIEATNIPYFYPDTTFDPAGPQYRRNALSNRRITKVTDFYTTRNLRAIACLWEAAERVADVRLRRFLQFVMTAIMHQGSRRNAWPIQKAMTGTLYIPSISIEQHFLGQVERKFDVTMNAIPAWDPRNTPAVICGSATNLARIPSESVDYVFTDPPFGSNIYYSEMNLMLEAWLGSNTDSLLEAVVHRKNDGGTKRLPDYARLMEHAFAELFRVLKPGRWATIEFNNSDGAVFEAVKDAVRKAGFEIANMLLLDKDQKSFKQTKGATGEEDVVDKDVLFNLHKPAAVRHETRAEDTDLEQQVAEAVRQHLATLPERIAADPVKYSDDHRTTSTINSMLMNTLIPKGVSVERLNLPFIERVCGRFFRKIGQRWYLRGEAVGGSGGELVAEEVTVSNELTAIAWLRQQLNGGPKLIGELKPRWMRATGLLPASLSQTLVLETLLRENFWRDAASNRWREPTPEEREKINDDRALRVLHDADRLAAGTLGRTPESGELCEWIAVLFDTCKELAEGDATAETHPGFDVTEAYQLIVKLSHRLAPEGVEPGTFSAAQKQVRVAGQRLAAAAENTEAAGPKRTRRPEDDKQTVLEF
jgi:hypothetical protein